MKPYTSHAPVVRYLMSLESHISVLLSSNTKISKNSTLHPTPCSTTPTEPQSLGLEAYGQLSTAHYSQLRASQPAGCNPANSPQLAPHSSELISPS